jgi:hypothetical protein
MKKRGQSGLPLLLGTIISFFANVLVNSNSVTTVVSMSMTVKVNAASFHGHVGGIGLLNKANKWPPPSPEPMPNFLDWGGAKRR